MIDKFDLFFLIILFSSIIYGLIVTVFNKQRFGFYSKYEKGLILIVYLLAIIFLEIWMFIPIISFLNLFLMDALYKESKLSEMVLQVKYGCLLKLKSVINNISIFFAFSFILFILSVTLIGVFSSGNSIRPELLNIVKLSYVELFQVIPQYKNILINSSVDDFVRIRNNDRIYKSINCGLLSNQECQDVRSKYL
jgi:hypothetical protein